ncbi:MAG: acyl-CoA desaturase [Gammaproteobacteria bacterium]|nr:acyl-CoA desaturase [Gammaproteobacteria bacterium]
MFNGFLNLPWWAYVLVTLGLTHVTILGVTIYLHRHQAHRALDLHPAVALFFRTWLWLTTGMTTRSWTAVHRKHHAFVETEADPHSPMIHGIRKVLWQGAELYRLEAANPETLAKYGHGTADDWLERHVFRHDRIGVSLMLLTNVLLFGTIGLTIWAVQMAWIPFFAAGVINGTAHWRGYRNFESRDSSTNLTPWGILIGGEELHNNHHAFASSARFSMKPWELDIGWCWIRALEGLGLARVKKVAPRLRADRREPGLDQETLRAMIAAQWQVMADYAQRVVRRVHREEVSGAAPPARETLRPLRGLLSRSPVLLGPEDEAALSQGLAASRTLAVVYQFQQRLGALFTERTASQETLLEKLQEWCREAETTGIAALADFSRRVQAYAP